MDRRKVTAGIVLCFLIVGVVVLVPLGCTRSAEPPTVPASQPTSVSTAPVEEPHSFIYEGPIPERFHEAPMLAKLVEEGKLPPVEQRLPQEPLVIPPVERIGKYGGTWRRAFTGPADGQNMDRLEHDHVIYYDMDGFTLVPHIARSWEVSDDGRTCTFKLRRGMKWSDGAPFTADDFVFGYEDILLNDELNPSPPGYMKQAGEPGVIEKVDDYTVRYVFARPYYVFPEICASLLVAGQSTYGGDSLTFYAPKHYLRRFHPKYTSERELTAKIAESGVATWVQLFRQKGDVGINRELPVVGPWQMTSPMTSQMLILERNPYYWAVDPEGNQLPYIDRIEMRLAGNLEVLNLWAIAGEIDMQHRHIMLSKVPMLRNENNARKGGYQVLFWPGRNAADCALYINQTWQGDAEIEKWIRDLDFRIALSLAIDREEINETVFLGTGTAKAFVPASDTPFYPGPEYRMNYAVRDLVRANEILDGLGLEKRDSEGFRLRTDGEGKLILNIATIGSSFLDYEKIGELLERHWREVGIKVNLRVEEGSLFSQRARNNEHQMCLWEAGVSENLWLYPGTTIPEYEGCFFASLVGRWHQTGGRQGQEPTGGLKRLLELYDEGKEVSLDERRALGAEVFRVHAENLYVIGMVGESAAFNGVVVVKNDFRNVPAKAPNSSALQNPGIARPEQFFFDR